MIRIKDILSAVEYLDFSGDEDAEISGPIALDPANQRSDVIMWCGEKYLDDLEGLEHGTVICPRSDHASPAENVNYIMVENPRRTFGQVLRDFFEPETEYSIAASARIAEEVGLPGKISIGEHVVIETDVKIGDGTIIGHNTVIQSGSRIGRNVKVGANCTIGGTGFGYELNEEGVYEVMPHLGNVEISDDVEIGNNTCIDRAVMGSTYLGPNVKIDNLVHIAHGARIGRNSLIIANAMVAGSVEIGEDVWIAPSASILNKLRTGDGAIVGMGAVVVRDVPAHTVVAGNPAKVIRQNKPPFSKER